MHSKLRSSSLLWNNILPTAMETDGDDYGMGNDSNLLEYWIVILSMLLITTWMAFLKEWTSLHPNGACLNQQQILMALMTTSTFCWSLMLTPGSIRVDLASQTGGWSSWTIKTQGFLDYFQVTVGDLLELSSEPTRFLLWPTVTITLIVAHGLCQTVLHLVALVTGTHVCDGMSDT